MRKETAKYIRHCLYCGKEFMSKRPQAKFCSNSHRAAYGALKNKNKGWEAIEVLLKNRIEELFDGFAIPTSNYEVYNVLSTLRDINIYLFEQFVEYWKKGESIYDHDFNFVFDEKDYEEEGKLEKANKRAKEMDKEIEELEQRERKKEIAKEMMERIKKLEEAKESAKEQKKRIEKMKKG